MIRRLAAPDGVELAFDDLGPPDAPAVVLMHGGGQTRHSWAGAAAALARAGWRVLNLDLRGHGASAWSPNGDYSLDTRVEDLRTLLDDVPGAFALVGASLGGYTALHAVAKGLPARALVLVDIVPHPEPAGIARIVTFMRAHPDGFASLEEAADAVAAYNPERPRPRDASGLRRNLRPGADGRLHWHWDPRILSDDGRPGPGFADDVACKAAHQQHGQVGPVAKPASPASASSSPISSWPMSPAQATWSRATATTPSPAPRWISSPAPSHPRRPPGADRAAAVQPRRWPAASTRASSARPNGFSSTGVPACGSGSSRPP